MTRLPRARLPACPRGVTACQGCSLPFQAWSGDRAGGSTSKSLKTEVRRVTTSGAGGRAGGEAGLLPTLPRRTLPAAPDRTGCTFRPRVDDGAPSSAAQPPGRPLWDPAPHGSVPLPTAKGPEDGARAGALRPAGGAPPLGKASAPTEGGPQAGGHTAVSHPSAFSSLALWHGASCLSQWRLHSVEC